eukprot:4026450-Pleurochrysis_carterae.AAC.1
MRACCAARSRASGEAMNDSRAGSSASSRRHSRGTARHSGDTARTAIPAVSLLPAQRRTTPRPPPVSDSRKGKRLLDIHKSRIPLCLKCILPTLACMAMLILVPAKRA